MLQLQSYFIPSSVEKIPTIFLLLTFFLYFFFAFISYPYPFLSHDFSSPSYAKNIAAIWI